MNALSIPEQTTLQHRILSFLTLVIISLLVFRHKESGTFALTAAAIGLTFIISRFGSGIARDRRATTDGIVALALILLSARLEGWISSPEFLWLCVVSTFLLVCQWQIKNWNAPENKFTSEELEAIRRAELFKEYYS